MGPDVAPLQLLRTVLHPLLMPALEYAAVDSLIADSEHLGDPLHAATQQALSDIVVAGMTADAALPSADELATRALHAAFPRLHEVRAPFDTAMELTFDASRNLGEAGRHAMESLLPMRAALMQSMQER